MYATYNFLKKYMGPDKERILNRYDDIRCYVENEELYYKYLFHKIWIDYYPESRMYKKDL